jgi:ribosome-binding factor A
MPKEFPRSQRIADQIQRDLAVLIQREMNDPRVRMVTVSAVKVSRDLSHAHVYVSSLVADVDHKDILKVLNRAAGFFKHHLGKSLHVHNVPDIEFFYDDSIEKGSRLSSLIDQAVASDSDKDS